MGLSNLKILTVVLCFIICCEAGYTATQNSIRSTLGASPTMSQILGRDTGIQNQKNTVYNRNLRYNQNNMNAVPGRDAGSISQDAHYMQLHRNMYNPVKQTNVVYPDSSRNYSYYGNGTYYYPSYGRYYTPTYYPVMTQTTSVKYGNGSSAVYSEDYIYPRGYGNTGYGYNIRRY